MKILRVLSIAGFAVVLASCASTGRDVPSVAEMLRETTGQNGRACVRLDDIQSYGVLDDNVVSINAMRNYYIATVLPGCVDLQTSVRTLFRGDFGELCGRTMDSLATSGDRCTINQMFEFEDRDEAFDVYNEVREEREQLKSLAAE